MNTRKIGIIMNGVTGRMGANQHLVRSLLAIRRQGGLPLGPEEVLMPEVILVGRNAARLALLAKANQLEYYSTDLDACLSDPAYSIYFDAQVTDLRVDAVRRAIRAGKHIYCEKPTATNARDALGLYQEAEKAGVKHGVVQDKLWLPGLMKLRYLRDSGFFGRILSVRGEFGYWVFDGKQQPCQRPSWNYRREEGGSLILDMFAHWRYIIHDLFGGIKAVSAVGATHIPERVDEQGRAFACTADDAAYATFELENKVLVHFNSSWCVRVRRDDLLTLQVDGTLGSAVAGLRRCWVQPDAATPRPVWNPDEESPIDYFSGWQEVPNNRNYENAFKAQWELFLRHVAIDAPYRWNLLEGAKGVQLAEVALQSWSERRWMEIPPLA